VNFKHGVWFVVLVLVVFGISTVVAVSAQEDVKYGGTLRVGLTRGPMHLDPARTVYYASTIIIYNVGEYLVRMSPQGNLYGTIATSWEASEDLLSWVFHLRQGVLFHNGRELTATDVQYTFDRIKDPELGSRYRSEYDFVESVDVIDDYTVRFNLSEPNVELPALISDSNAAGGVIVPREEAEKPEFDTHPILAGPFKLESQLEEVKVVLTKNEDYFLESLPRVDKIVFQVVPEPGVRMDALRTGDLDLIEDVPAEQYSIIESDPKLVLARTTSVWNDILWFNFDEYPGSNPYFRKAVACALDYKALLAGARFGQGEINTTLLSPLSRSAFNTYSVSYEHDPDRARKYLGRAGIKEGETVNLEIITMPGEVREAEGQMIKEQLGKFGIEVKFSPLEKGEYIARATDRDFPALITGYSEGGTPDIDLYRYHFSKTPNNLSHSDSVILDKLLTAGRSTLDPQERGIIYSAANAVIEELCPWIVLHWVYRAWAHGSHVKGFVPAPNSVFLLRDVWVDR